MPDWGDYVDPRIKITDASVLPASEWFADPSVVESLKEHHIILQTFKADAYRNSPRKAFTNVAFGRVVVLNDQTHEILLEVPLKMRDRYIPFASGAGKLPDEPEFKNLEKVLRDLLLKMGGNPHKWEEVWEKKVRGLFDGMGKALNEEFRIYTKNQTAIQELTGLLERCQKALNGSPPEIQEVISHLRVHADQLAVLKAGGVEACRMFIKEQISRISETMDYLCNENKGLLVQAHQQLWEKGSLPSANFSLNFVILPKASPEATFAYNFCHSEMVLSIYLEKQMRKNVRDMVSSVLTEVGRTRPPLRLCLDVATYLTMCRNCAWQFLITSKLGIDSLALLRETLKSEGFMVAPSLSVRAGGYEEHSDWARVREEALDGHPPRVAHLPPPSV